MRRVVEVFLLKTGGPLREIAFAYFYSMILTSPGSLGRTPKKIISLVPSQTELLHHLGLEEETVAITKFCIHPAAWFKTKTRIGGTKSLHIEKIRSLNPELIIANKEENIKEQVEELAEDFPVWITDISNLDTSIKMIGNIGQLVGKEPKADNLKIKIETGFAYLKKTVSVLGSPVRTAYFIWKDPYMTVGGDTFISDMMQRSGFQNIYAGSNRYPEVDIRQLKEMGCELILLSSEPFPFSEKHIAELQAGLPGIKILLVDGEMFSWYGSRLLQSPSYFKKLLLSVFKSKT